MANALVYWEPKWDVSGLPDGFTRVQGDSALQATQNDKWLPIAFQEKPVYGLEAIQGGQVIVTNGGDNVRCLVTHGGTNWTFENNTWVEQADISQGMTPGDLFTALTLHFPIGWLKIGFVVGVNWTTGNPAPVVVGGVKLLVAITAGQVVVNVVDQLLSQLQNDLRYPTKFALHTDQDMDSVVLAPNGQVQVVDCQRVWRGNHPEENILAGFDPTTQNVSFTQTVGANTDLFFTAMVQPKVYVVVGRDSYKVQPAPAVYLERVSVESRLVHSGDGVSPDDGDGYEIRMLRVADVTLDFMYFARRAQEVLAIQEGLRAWFGAHPQVLFDTLGQFCDIISMDDGEITPAETTAKVVVGGPLRVKIRNVVIPEGPAQTVPVVRRLKWQFDVSE